MSAPVEREIKLPYESASAARAAVSALGATLRAPRRLQADVILDTTDGRLRDMRSALRVRIEPERAYLTFKGTPQQGPMKVREEIETAVDDGSLTLTILGRLGFTVAFTYHKYREEHALPDVLIAIDETPVGTFVELEGSEAGITTTAVRLGRLPHEYIVDSYRTLYVRECERRGVTPSDRMVFSE
ncbi:MAG: class IV adenylate cyclase [Vicinamibacterales bacterium]